MPKDTLEVPDASTASMQQQPIPNVSVPEDKPLVLKAALKSARSRLTKARSKADAAINAAAADESSLEELDFLKASITQLVGEVSSSMHAYVNCSAVCSNEELLEQEFSKNDSYVEDAHDTIDALRRRRNEVARALGLPPETPYVSNQTSNQGQQYFQNADRSASLKTCVEQQPSADSVPAPRDVSTVSQQQAQIQHISQEATKFSGDHMKSAERQDLVPHQIDPQQLKTAEKNFVLEASILGKAAVSLLPRIIFISCNWPYPVDLNIYGKVGSRTVSSTKQSLFFRETNLFKSVLGSVITSLGIVPARNDRASAARERQTSRQELKGLEFLRKTNLLGIEDCAPDESESPIVKMMQWSAGSVQIDPGGHGLLVSSRRGGFRQRSEILRQPFI